MSNIIQRVLDWGRQSETQDIVDQTGHFSPCEVESLRRQLRKECQESNPGITGSWRKGYEMMIGKERIGVTNGYGPFKIYYRKTKVDFTPNPALFGPRVPAPKFNVNQPVPPEVIALVEQSQSRWQPLSEDAGLAGPAQAHIAPYFMPGHVIPFE